MRSITLALTAAVCGATLCAAGGASAQQLYEWSPQKTAVRLTGTLTFVPADHGASFQCKVEMDFKTGNVRRGEDALPQVTSATVKGRGCEAVHFTDLPWYLGTIDSQNELISPYGWDGGIEECDAPDGSGVEVLAGGKLEFEGLCLSGILTSNPPISVVPQP